MIALIKSMRGRENYRQQNRRLSNSTRYKRIGMAIDPETGVAVGVGGSGIIAMIAAFFHREKLQELRNDFNEHKKTAITTALCSPCQRLAEAHRNELKENVSEIKADVKDLKKEVSQLHTDVRTAIDLVLNRQRPVI